MVSLTMGMAWPRLTMVRFSKHRGISAGITTIPQEMMAIKGDEFPPWFQASNRLWSWWNWPRMMKHWYYHQILYHQISPDIYHQIGIYNDNYHQVLDFIYPKWPWFFFGSLKNMISWDRSRNPPVSSATYADPKYLVSRAEEPHIDRTVTGGSNHCRIMTLVKYDHSRKTPNLKN